MESGSGQPDPAVTAAELSGAHVTGRLLVIIPTYDELENLPLIVGRLRAAVPEADILVADDNSPDGTGALADELAAADPQVHRRNGGSFSSGGLAQEYGFTDVDGSRPDCWRYLAEVQGAGLPADASGYR